MAVLTDRMKEIFNKQGTFVLTTASKKGVPNAAPVGAVKLVDDETVLISDQFMIKSRANMEENPAVAISFWENAEGYQIKGKAEVITQGERFVETAEWIRKLGEQLGVPLKSKGAIVIRIEEIYCVSPGPDAGKKLA